MSRSRCHLLVVACLSIAWFASCRPSSSQAGGGQAPRDSVQSDTVVSAQMQAGDPERIPDPLLHWIWTTLRSSGELGWIDSFVSTKLEERTRLRFSGDTWTVDFRGLDIGVLGGADEEKWTDFGLRVLVAGTRLCPGNGRVLLSSSIRSDVEGLDQVRCTVADHEKAIHKWFSVQFGRAPSPTEFRLGSGAPIAFLRLACPRPDTLRRVGLLRNLEIDTLEIEGCVLPVDEQRALPDRIGRLGLVDARGQAFVYSGRIGTEVSIERGDFTWVDLQAQKGENPSLVTDRAVVSARVRLSGLAVCRPDLLDRLSKAGVRIDSARCEGYPSDLFAERDRWEREFENLRAGNGAARGSIGLRHEDLPVYDLRRLDRTEAVGIDEDPFEEVGPVRYTPRTVRYGKDGMDFGDAVNPHYFLRGEALLATVRGKAIRAGMKRSELIAILGKPSFDKGPFLAWGSNLECDQGPFSIQARFDSQGALVGWWDRSEPMCGC